MVSSTTKKQKVETNTTLTIKCAKFALILTSTLILARQNVRVTGVDDGNDRAVEELPARRAELGVVATVVMDLRLGEHGQVLHFRLAKGGAIRRDEDHLRLAGAQALQAGLVTEDGLAGLHDELETGVHRLGVLLLLSSVGCTQGGGGGRKRTGQKMKPMGRRGEKSVRKTR